MRGGREGEESGRERKEESDYEQGGVVVLYLKWRDNSLSDHVT